VCRCCAATRRRKRLLLLLLLLHACCTAVVIAAGVSVSTRAQLQAGSNLVKQALRQQPCCLGAMQHLAIVTGNMTVADGCSSKPTAATANGDTQERLTLLLLLLLSGQCVRRHQR
jgi:hypothetical protein